MPKVISDESFDLFKVLEQLLEKIPKEVVFANRDDKGWAVHTTTELLENEDVLKMVLPDPCESPMQILQDPYFELEFFENMKQIEAKDIVICETKTPGDPVKVDQNIPGIEVLNDPNFEMEFQNQVEKKPVNGQ